MELEDLLSILDQEQYLTIKTDDRVRPFQIEWAFVGDIERSFPEWLNALVTRFTMDNDGDYVITIVPDDKEE